MENFLLPAKAEFLPGENELRGSLVVTPCYHGYGTTLGNALRRVLLSSLTGGAVEAFKVKGAQHEFTTLEGVQEDIVEVMLNLKQLAVKVFVDEPVTLSLTKKGPGVVTAGDITKNSNVEIVNKDLVICTLTANKTLDLEIIVGKGRGFRPVEEKDKLTYPLGTIVIDSVYTPVKDVGYKVEYTRVGDITNFEKLIVNIETNGTISPQDAIKESVKILMDHFGIIADSVGSQISEIISAPEVEIVEPVASEPEIVEEVKEAPKKKTKKK